MFETWLNVLRRGIVSVLRYVVNGSRTNGVSVENDEEEDGVGEVQMVQRVLVRFQGINVETWLRIVMLVSRASRL